MFDLKSKRAGELYIHGDFLYVEFYLGSRALAVSIHQ